VVNPKKERTLNMHRHAGNIKGKRAYQLPEHEERRETSTIYTAGGRDLWEKGPILAWEKKQENE